MLPLSVISNVDVTPPPGVPAPKLSCGVVFSGVQFNIPRGVLFPPFNGVPNFFLGEETYSPLIGGPPVFSEGVRIAETGVVGVRNPLIGLLLAVI